MKKLIFVVLVMLTFTLDSSATSKKGDLITDKGYDYVVNPANKNVVLHPGITCEDWTKVLRRFVQAKFGKSLEEVRNESKVADNAKGILYNTYYFGNKASGFGPVKEINKNVFEYNGQPWLVVQCAQMVGTDEGMINNAITGTEDLTPIGYYLPVLPPAEPEEDKTTDQKEEKMRHDVYHHLDGAAQVVVSPGAGVAESQTPWGWIIAILGIVAIIAFLVMYLDGSRNRRDSLRREMIDEQQGYLTHYYRGIDMFFGAHERANRSAAASITDAHRTVNMYANSGQVHTPPAAPGDNQGR